MLKSFKFKLYPNKLQSKQIDSTLNSCRFIYNQCLNERIQVYQNLKNNKEQLKSYKYKTIKQLSQEHDFLNLADSQALRQAQLNLEASYKRFFSKLSKYPKFKSKHNSRQSYKTTNINNNIRFQEINNEINFKSLKLPKLNYVKCKGYNPKDSFLIKSATIIKENNHYYCILLCEVDLIQKHNINTNRGTIGIDIGIEKFITCSNGQVIDSIETKQGNVKILTLLKNKQNKIKSYQKHLSRKKKGSNRRLKCKQRLNKLNKQNSDFQSQLFYKIVDKICNENQVIKIENLSLKGMMKLKKNKKFRVSKSFQLLSVNKFYSILKQKSVEYNTEIIQTDKFYPSSKLCSNCGNKKSNLNLSDRIYNCDQCNLNIDRDLNASINIQNYNKSDNGSDYIHGEIIRLPVALQQVAVSMK
jgi:putative transposase